MIWPCLGSVTSTMNSVYVIAHSPDLSVPKFEINETQNNQNINYAFQMLFHFKNPLYENECFLTNNPHIVCFSLLELQSSQPCIGIFALIRYIQNRKQISPVFITNTITSNLICRKITCIMRPILIQVFLHCAL